LVQGIRPIVGHSQVGPVHVSASLSLGPVADVVVAVLELLARHWRLVGPVLASGANLPEGIILMVC